MKTGWWNQPLQETDLSFARYKIPHFIKENPLNQGDPVPADTPFEIIIGSRPDHRGCSKEFYDSIDGWISVTNKHVIHPPGRYQWFPWDEGKDCNLETFYGVVKTLYHWIRYDKLTRFYVHCDAGTHRAPTVFGAFLLAYYTKEEREEIVKNVELVGREHLSNPLEYIEAHLHSMPMDLAFFQLLGKYHIDDLEQLISHIKKHFENRYCGRARSLDSW